MGFRWARAGGQVWDVVLTVVVCTAASACGGRSTSSVEDGVGERLYVLNYGSDDVSAFEVDTTGALSPLEGSPFRMQAAPRAAAAAPGHNTLYVVEGDRLASYAIDNVSGALKLVGETTAGYDVEKVALSPSENVVYAGHCSESGGSISVFPIDYQNVLAPLPSQSIPTAHCVNGIAIDARHRFLYVSSQYGNDGALEGFSIDRSSGTLMPLAGSPFASFLATAIAIAPNGEHVYVCDQEAFVRSYDVDAQTGALSDHRERATTGYNPFSIAIDREGRRLFVANWSSGSLSSYVLDPSTGFPGEAAGSPYPAGASPHVLAIDASSRVVYINNQGSPTIEVLAIGNSGELSPLSGSPFTVGEQPIAAVIVP